MRVGFKFNMMVSITHNASHGDGHACFEIGSRVGVLCKGYSVCVKMVLGVNGFHEDERLVRCAWEGWEAMVLGPRFQGGGDAG